MSPLIDYSSDKEDARRERNVDTSSQLTGTTVDGHQRRPNAFADAISQFIEEVRDDEDKKSRFYREVMVTASRLHLSDQSLEATLCYVDDLSRYVKDLEVQHRKKSFTRRMLKSLQPLVDGLLQYTNAMDTMIQADPTAGALIYGGAKLVLQLASGYSRYFDKISDMMIDIGDSLMCFHIYSDEFSSNEKMIGILIRSYKDILGFWREASRILDQRGARFFVGGLLTPFEASYSKFKDRLDRNTRLVDSVAQALNIQDQGKFRRTQNVEAGVAQEVIKTLDRASSFPREEQGQIVTKHETIRKWIAGGRSSKIDPASDLERHLAAKHMGTCEWIFDDATFLNWKSSSRDDVLWLNAAPGAGKSVLSSAIIDRLKSTGKTERRHVLYFFCRFDDPDKCHEISVLRSIALQALKFIKYIPDELYQLFLEEYSSDDKYVATSLIAEKVVEFLLKRIEHIYVVIDGLCECQDAHLLDSLVRLSSKKGLGVTKWLFTSRNEVEIHKKFEAIAAETISISKAVVERDIRKYLEDNVDLLFGTKDQLDRLTRRSEGNFLGIRLTIDPLRDDEVTCEEEFEETLRNFQPELGRCWYRSLEKLTRRKDSIQELARTILNTVALATQPMTFNELVDLLTIEIDQEPSARRNRKKSIVLSACTPFVELDDCNDLINPTVRLAHKTVREFLTQDPASLDFVHKNCHKFFVKWEEGNLELGKKCLTYLSYKRYSNPDDLEGLSDFDKMSQDHPFLIYAALFWHQHFDRYGGSREAYERIRDFLRSPNIWTCIRVQSRYAPHLFARLSYDTKLDTYRMHSPHNPNDNDDPVHSYYADALPTWIDKYDDMGDDLVWGYHMFVREWAEILILHPESIQCYFAKVLGQRSFWSTKYCSTDTNQIYALEDHSLRRQLMLFKSEGQASKRTSKCWFSLDSNGVEAKFGVFNEIPNTPIIVLEDWQIFFGSRPGRKSATNLTNLDHVHLRRSNQPMQTKRALILPESPVTACSGLIIEKVMEEEEVHPSEEDDPPLWTLELDHPSSSDGNWPERCRDAKKFVDLGRIPQTLIHDLLDQTLWTTFRKLQTGNAVSSAKQLFPENLKYVADLLESYKKHGIWDFVDKSSSIKGDYEASSYRFRLVQRAPDTESDDSDDENDSESEDEHSSSQLLLHILEVTKGGGEPHWYHHTVQLSVRKPSKLFFHKTMPWLFCPKEASSLLFINLDTWKSSPIVLSQDLEGKGSLVAQAYHFSSNSDLLHQASVFVESQHILTLTQSFFKLTATALETTTIEVMEAPYPTKAATWRSTSSGPNTDCHLTWLGDTLYAALGSFEILILRFPVPSLTSQSDATSTSCDSQPVFENVVQTLPKPLYMPSSASSRDVHFFIHQNLSTGRIHATFCLNSLPVLELPPLVLDFDLEGLCGPWEEYRLNDKDQQVGLEEFMKGMYAAKDQRFSLPIRSGLEWRRSLYVSCW